MHFQVIAEHAFVWLLVKAVFARYKRSLGCSHCVELCSNLYTAFYRNILFAMPASN